MKKYILCGLFLLFGNFHIGLQAHDFDITPEYEIEFETYKLDIDSIIGNDSIITLDLSKSVDALNLVDPIFKPDPKKAVIYSVIFPGLGQIYNRKYWKLPIVYGGFLGVVYAFTWNGRYYNDYADAFRDMALGTGNSWKDFLPNVSEQTILHNATERERYQDLLRRKRDYYRRYRDISVLVGVGLYALCIIDAYVDAQLFDFNMSEDLSMTVAPMVSGPTSMSGTTVGVQLRIVF